jgi:RimJ/RimL family protein N-acetyltransferase
MWVRFLHAGPNNIMIPIKLLSTIQKDRLKQHLFSMTDEDVRMRFGMAMNHDAISAYLDKSFDQYGRWNMWFIVEDGDKVIGSVHVAIDTSGEKMIAELGFTVAKEYRNKGVGNELFYRGSTWARMVGARVLCTQCLSENKVMQHIARKNGMTVVTEYGESEASILMDKPQVAAAYEDFIMGSMSFIDNSIRKQNWFMKALLEK